MYFFWSILLRILFIGDIYARPGRRAVSELLPKIRENKEIDFCIANGENTAGGFGITENIARKLYSYGVDVITSGNHVWHRKESREYIQNAVCLLRPANYPPEAGGVGYGVFESAGGIPVGVLNLQGRTFMTHIDCPFRLGRQKIEQLKESALVIIVDFHGEATSEKIAFGWYTDGHASAVVGTHTHVQTADERILPGGTAYITDVGMTGPHDSVIGAQKDIAIRRFLTGLPERFEPAEADIKFCAVLLDIDESTGKAESIERIRLDVELVE